MEQRPDLRASDQDRQKIADQLKDAVSEGRIDLSEYDERLASAYAAKTYGELAQVTADLPLPEKQAVAPRQGAPMATQQQIAEAEKAAFARRARISRRLWRMWRPWAAASAVTTGVWLAILIANGGEVTFFWPVFVIVPWGLMLAVKSFGVVGSGERYEWEGVEGRGPAGHQVADRHASAEHWRSARRGRRGGCC
ncbi:MAG: DUF1707 domain-containing protein [Micromonosporaceae bacterium]|nr:DUF1707 domain-containing protein [Micromonosporaceae bacterium]